MQGRLQESLWMQLESTGMRCIHRYACRHIGGDKNMVLGEQFWHFRIFLFYENCDVLFHLMSNCSEKSTLVSGQRPPVPR